MARRFERLGHHLSFDAPQRRVLAVLLAALVAYGVVRRISHPAYIDAPQPPAGDRSEELADKLDPNTADAADLAALPGLGDKRAKAIVARRDKIHARDPSAVVFTGPDDLYPISGFGRSTVEQLRPFLTFPATRPSGDSGRTPP